MQKGAGEAESQRKGLRGQDSETGVRKCPECDRVGCDAGKGGGDGPWWGKERPLRCKERPESERGVCMGSKGAGKGTSEGRVDPRGWRLGPQGSRKGPGTAGSGG